MTDWISTKNNNKSKDWRNNPQSVLKEIKNMAERYDSTKVTKVKRFTLEKLSFEIILAIRDIADNIAATTELEASKLEEFMQCLVSYCIENHSDCLVEIPSSVFKACKNGSRARYIKDHTYLMAHRRFVRPHAEMIHLFVGPDGQLVTEGIAKVKTSATREIVGLLCNCAAIADNAVLNAA
jgi:hypothetical protein